MPALLMRMSRRPNFCAAPLTKSRHAASVPTSACVKAILAPVVSSSAATRWPRSPSRSQNATLAPSARKRLTVASPVPEAPPVTAATLPSSLPMFATFHCICETPIHDTPYPSGGHRLVGPAWVSDLYRLRKPKASAFGTCQWADSLRLGSNCRSRWRGLVTAYVPTADVGELVNLRLLK